MKTNLIIGIKYNKKNDDDFPFNLEMKEKKKQISFIHSIPFIHFSDRTHRE